MPFIVADLKLSSCIADYGLVRSAAEDESAMVGEGQATAFVTGISMQNKQDVMNSTLLAQLAASGKYNRLTQTSQWYDEYKYILENVGWLVTSFKFDEHSLSNVAVSVDKIVLDFLTTFLDPTQLSLMARVLEALANSSDPVVNIFTRSTADDHQSNFQLGTCSEDRDKNVMFSIGAFTYTTTESITNVLFTKIKSGSAHFMNAFQNMILNQQIYAVVREAVLEKLGDNAKKLIGDLVLPPGSRLPMSSRNGILCLHTLGAIPCRC
ncbi:hypothetical protein BJ912DRAFT_1043752 [Pholiota molesta]|nr:hypothetical protein BJ912DRAFT_1043752 [Pholiota molesta]